MVDRVLMIALHYPPCAESSGYQRTLAFSSYLPDFGWHPVVLTAHPRVYKQQDTRLNRYIPDGVPVRRAFALDTRRHLSIRNRYPLLLAAPDRWVSWVAGAIPAGLGLIRRYRPRVLWSTYPSATAHLAAYLLHRITGLPWIADFRDPVATGGEGLDARVRRWIESRTVANCQRAVFTTAGATSYYANRFPNVPEERWCTVPNGYDESHFSSLTLPNRSGRPAHRVKLVHSGHLYRRERNPLPFFQALGRLVRSGRETPETLQVVLRAAGNEAYYREAAQSAGVGGLVALAPPLPHEEALAEMADADGLLLFQGGECGRQVPAKLFEYMRVQRPILALTDPFGETAAVMRDCEIENITPLDGIDMIERDLTIFLRQLRSETASIASPTRVGRYERSRLTADLAALFDSVVLSKNSRSLAAN